VALMVLEHQSRMVNLITRLGWEARVAAHDASATGTAAAPRVRAAAADLVDYLLFSDEEPLPEPVRGSSGFADRFAARGPSDARKRSLFQLDLARWLFRYPCSYMIYSPAFDALPDDAKDAVYRRLWDVLSGNAAARSASRQLSAADRLAVVQILRDTKPDLPRYFMDGGR
jgi:hypothetical protein